MANMCFFTQDGLKIHFANVTEIVMYKVDKIEFVFINGHRLINDKTNKRLLKLMFPFKFSTGNKCIFTYEPLKKEDSIEYEEVIVNG